MNTITANQTATLEHLQWRYATKRMTGEAVPEDKVEEILQSIRLSASSFGLQPYNVVVVTDEHLRHKLRHAAYGQHQLTEGSHVLVLAHWDKITQAQIDHFFECIKEQRGVSDEDLAGYKQQVEGVLKMTPEQQQQWNAKQAYIAMGSALIAAAELRVDACPMEGFDKHKFDEILGLKELGLMSAAMICLGYRDEENDYLADAPKVRYPLHELVIRK